jgi:hypothetical protein
MLRLFVFCFGGGGNQARKKSRFFYDLPLRRRGPSAFVTWFSMVGRGGIGYAAFVSPELVFVVLVVLQVREAGVSSITGEPTIGPGQLR